MKIEGATALVTGANRGIGKAFAEELLARGAAKVYAGVRDVAGVTDPRLVPVQLDVTDADRVKAVAAELTDVDLVVNNAGTGRPAPPLSASLEDARFELEANYLSIVSMTEAFAPVLADNGGGAIVNMLSIVSFVGAPNLATYSASKAAAWSYSNASRVQLKGQGTEVVGVHVGYVDTDLIASLEVEKIQPQEVAIAGFDALEKGQPEALVDEWTREVKAGLSDDQRLIYPGVEEEFFAQIAAA
ncbi:MAG TPA: SDR family oxidoreductase [Solirubrobacterales bacterium]|jgi:NAD(P)-dependent dehydrogenase (short-subunit alcohol dehydrogenase family)